MTCKGICHRYRTGKNPDGRYGITRCSVCDIIKHDSNCPCGCKLRKTPRNKEGITQDRYE